MEKRHSFASRLSLKTVLLATALFLASISVIGIGGGRIVENSSLQYAGQCLSSTVLDMQSIISETETVADAVAMTAEEHFQAGHMMDTSRCYSLLSRTLQNNPDLYGCGFFFAPYAYDKSNAHIGIYVNNDWEHGGYVYEWDTDESTAVDGWDYFDNDFYTLTRRSDKRLWLTPYLEEVMANNGVNTFRLLSTYVYPMHGPKGEFIGVYAVDLQLDWLNEKLIKMRPYEHSNVFLLDSCLNIICNPLAQDPYNGSIYDTPFIEGFDYIVDSTLTFASVSKMADEDGFLRIKEGLKSAYLVFDKMENGWIVCVSSTSNDVFADLKKLWLILVVLTVVVLAVLFFLNKRMIRHLSQPVMQFANAAREITEVKFTEPVAIPEVHTNDELEELGNALNFMQDSAIQYISDLTTTTKEKERLKSELDVARNIQNQMLCRNFPTMDKGGIFADSIPAKEVGGDLYDFFINNKDIYFILGDVSGKGVPAALLMAITIAAFRSVGKRNHTMGQIVTMINKTYCKSNEDMMFVTLVVGKIDTETGRMEYCNAGHNPMVIVDAEGKSRFINAKRNLACGVMSDFEYESEEIVLGQGSRLVVYSDGITEAENLTKAQYGEQRLLEWASTATAEALKDAGAVSSLISSVREFTAGAEQNDDMTVMSISI